MNVVPIGRALTGRQRTGTQAARLQRRDSGVNSRGYLDTPTWVTIVLKPS